jgi:hypothetical protein
MLSDYEQMRKGTMVYKQFYNIYSKEVGFKKEGDFFKKSGFPIT